MRQNICFLPTLYIENMPNPLQCQRSEGYLYNLRMYVIQVLLTLFLNGPRNLS